MGTPVALMPAPEMLTLDMVTLAVPELETANVCEVLLPMFTLPKLKLAGFTER